MTPATLRAMVAAGATAEVIAAAWLAEMEAEQARLTEKRASDAARKARQRSREVTECHADTTGHDVTDADTAGPPALDKESSPQTPFKEINPSPRERETRARGERLPEGWNPEPLNPATKAGQIIERRGQQWAAGALETFTNHWRGKAGRDACKVDWQATWGNWVIEEDRRDGRGQHWKPGNGSGSGDLRGSRPDPALDMRRQALAELAAERAGGDQAGGERDRLALPAAGAG